jgi:hypothetical protein
MKKKGIKMREDEAGEKGRKPEKQKDRRRWYGAQGSGGQDVQVEQNTRKAETSTQTGGMDGK